MSEYALEMLGITKTFSKVTALDEVDFKVREGEIHALIGENGAGKSTLMKVLSGVYKPDKGSIKMFGEDFMPLNPKDAINKGIAIIYQELNQAGELNAIENVMLGHEKNRGGFISSREEYEFAARYLDYVSHGALPNYKVPVKRLSVAQQQMVEIAKALSYNARIIIMDEPTDALTNDEIEILFSIVRKLKADGITVIYISHRLEELFELCDRVTVLRDGKYIVDEDIPNVNKDWLISKMIGRDLKDSYPPRHRIVDDEVVLEVEGLTGDRFRDISFRLHKGEILALTGLVGAGRTEVLRAIFGADRIKAGTIRVFGKEEKINHPSKALKCGFGFATEDRKAQGLFLTHDIRSNISEPALSKISTAGFISRKKENELAGKYFKELRVVSPDMNKKCKFLSGGNQQKVVLGKWLASGCRILFLDEPTRGIDVGAKYEIYQLMDKLVQEGVSILMISSEMPEVMGVADRAIVLHEGDQMGEVTYENFSEEILMKMGSGEKLA